MDMTTLVESLGRACGIDLAFTEGRCTLRFDDAHEVTFEQDGDALLLHGVVGDDSRLADPVNLRLLLAASEKPSAAHCRCGPARAMSCCGNATTPSPTTPPSRGP